MSGGQFHLDPYIEVHSCIHAADARLKLSALLIFMLSTALLPAGAWAAYILLAAVLFSSMLLSQIPFGLLLRRSFVLELPLVLVVLPLLFKPGGSELLHLQAAGQSLVMTSDGLLRFSSILLKMGLSIQAAVLLSAVTRFEDVLVGLSGLGYPKLLNAILALMWRYMFILAAEARRMLAARTARSGRPAYAGSKGGGFFWGVRVTGGMAGTLLLRSLERAERVYQAMKARGYDGEVRALEARQLSAGEKRKIVAMAMVALLLLLAARQVYRG